MTDRAPRTEGMSNEDFRPWLVRQIRACDEQMRAAKHQTKRARFADSALVLQGILQEFDRRQSGEVSPLSEVMTDRFAMDDAKVQAYAKLELSDEAISLGWINWSDTAILACREIARLRADEATLKVRADEAHAAHSASFGALATLSAALFDGEVDDYGELAEKIIARVRQLEADGATLRERVKKLPSPIEHRGELVDDVPTGRTFYVCDWCDARWKATKQHPVNGCLYVDGREGAPTPTLPPITNDVLTDVQLAWWLSHATDPWQVAIGRELTGARRTLAELAEDTRRLLLKTINDFKASAPKEPTPHE